MRDIQGVEKDAVIQGNTSISADFFPKITQTIIKTQKINGRFVCQSDSHQYFYDPRRGDRLQKASIGRFLTRVKERRVKFIRKGGEN